MIKCEVVFDGEKIHIGRFVVVVDSYTEGNPVLGYHAFNIWRVRTDQICSEKIFRTQAEAIKYCMEN